MREVIDCVLRSLHVYPGSAVSWNRQDCDRQSMQRVQNTWSIGTGLCLTVRTQMQFSKEPFSWFWSQEITKGPQALTAKPAAVFPEFVYIIVILSYVFARNCSPNRLNLCLLFFRWFPHGKSAVYKKLPETTRKSLVYRILLALCT